MYSNLAQSQRTVNILFLSRSHAPTIVFFHQVTFIGGMFTDLAVYLHSDTNPQIWFCSLVCISSHIYSQITFPTSYKAVIYQLIHPKISKLYNAKFTLCTSAHMSDQAGILNFQSAEGLRQKKN